MNTRKPEGVALPENHEKIERGSDENLQCDIEYVHAELVQNLQILPWDTASRVAELFKILGDPTRVRLLDVLAQAECCVCDLAQSLGMSQSAVSHQLRVLRNQRLVRFRREGKMIYYALDDEHVTALFRQGLQHISEI